jgi:hypothetical protein
LTGRSPAEAASTDSAVSNSVARDLSTDMMADPTPATPDFKATTKAESPREDREEQVSRAGTPTPENNDNNVLGPRCADEQAADSTSIISNVTQMQQDQRREEQRDQHFQKRHEERQKKRLKEVAVQAFLYVGGFLLTQLPVMIVGIMATGRELSPADEAELFPFLMLRAILWPLQGFWNLLIFIRPAYIRET